MARILSARHRSGLRLAAAALLCMALAACGFHLKGATPVPFKTIYTNINLDTEFGARLRRTLLANSPDTRFVASRNEADVYLHQISDAQNLRQVSLDAEGRVEEYELALTFSFEVLDREDRLILAPTTLHALRELPYNDRIVQAKESEITRTFSIMRNGLIDQILRRLSAPEVANAYANASSQPVANPLTTPTPAAPPAQPASPVSRPVSPLSYH